jgi:hypothetical protein
VEGTTGNQTRTAWTPVWSLTNSGLHDCSLEKAAFSPSHADQQTKHCYQAGLCESFSEYWTQLVIWRLLQHETRTSNVTRGSLKNSDKCLKRDFLPFFLLFATPCLAVARCTLIWQCILGSRENNSAWSVENLSSSLGTSVPGFGSYLKPSFHFSPDSGTCLTTGNGHNNVSRTQGIQRFDWRFYTTISGRVMTRDSNLLAIFAREREDSSHQPKTRVFWSSSLLRVFALCPHKNRKSNQKWVNLWTFGLFL